MQSPTKQTPRGIRNNNPLNIRIGNTWLGEVPNPTDSDFEQFVHVRYGLRAAFCILRRYIKRYGRNTIAKIINAWAPPSENNTGAYIQAVASSMKLNPDDEIRYEDVMVMCELVQCMARHECGQVLPMKEIIEGYKIA